MNIGFTDIGKLFHIWYNSPKSSYRRIYMPSIIKECQQCKKEYSTPGFKANKSRYCSNECKYEAQRNKVVRFCEECKGEFMAIPSNVRRGYARFCSAKCRDIYCGRFRTGENNSFWKDAKVKLICETCGRQFEKFRSAITRKGWGRFCSIECRAKGTSGENSVLWTGGNVKVNCTNCKREFFARRYRTASWANLFCSTKCAGEWQAENVSGDSLYPNTGHKVSMCETCGREFLSNRSSIRRFCSPACRGKARSPNLFGKDNPNWRGGISFEPYPETFNKVFKEMIRARDSYSCILCGKYGNSVHHISYVKMDTNPENCITMCKVCHGKVNGNRTYWIDKLSPIAKQREEERRCANATPS